MKTIAHILLITLIVMLIPSPPEWAYNRGATPFDTFFGSLISVVFFYGLYVVYRR